MGVTTSAPTDLRSAWLNVARRLQSVARSQGLSVLKIIVLVDADGEPIGWFEPEQIKIEPKACRPNLVTMLTGRSEGL
jgi:hypothetical protein